jgi:hypothetical protein
VGLGVGEGVAVSSGVAVGVGLSVGSGVGDGVGDGVGEGVGDGVGEGVAVVVKVAVAVAVAVGVGVGVGVGVPTAALQGTVPESQPCGAPGPGSWTRRSVPTAVPSVGKEPLTSYSPSKPGPKVPLTMSNATGKIWAPSKLHEPPLPGISDATKFSTCAASGDTSNAIVPPTMTVPV